MSSIEPFNRLVKLAARAFYDDITTKGENQPKNGRGDNRGIAVVVLDALTRRQWVREEDLAKDLKLHTKQLRRTLRFFEEEKLVARDHRKETAKGAKMHNAAVAATGDGPQTGREGEEKLKMHTHSYCCLDYAQIYDVVRYRLHRMKKKLKDELESKNTVQEYICPNCSKRYTALDALRLVTPYDEYFHCESCNGILVAESDKFAAQELGDGDDNARRRRHEKLKDMLKTMEEQLKPLMDQLARVKDLPVPEFGSLQAWELRASAANRAANGDLNANDPSKSSNGLGFGGTPMPYVGETKVEVAFTGIDDKGESVKTASANAPMKVLPPWMIKEGMNLTREQRGEAKAESKTGGNLTASGNFDDKKSTTANEDEKNIQDEYIKAYYAALLKRQQEQEESVKKEEESTNATISHGNLTAERQVGMKSKRDDYEGDNAEWEEPPPTGGATGYYKVGDLNMEAEVSEEEEDIDWEEG
ncbi:transcription initiation factor IIE subunit alpha-like [Andrographis paniculata]|uniref:transcription initiation factor IIE subunit alpha-like n=1 Tax=Andrographis paniculata TaxID=175694 RepID=UPI0021E87347|nr:transcription initiation factor IIE subunit alpha-like [Andrographis paniculata]